MVTLSNPHLGRLHSAVIRGAMLPQGPKAFEFLLPPHWPVSVSPRVGVVQPGKVRARAAPRAPAVEWHVRCRALLCARLVVVAGAALARACQGGEAIA